VAVANGYAILAGAKAAGVPAAIVGQAGGVAFAADGLFTLPLARLRDAHEGWMPAFMG
jgi:phosphoribosylformylglycinamidine synthase